MEIGWEIWLLGFLIAAFIFTAILKKFTDAQVFLNIASMVKTKKPLPWFDKLAKIGRPLDWFAEIGLVLGFGAIAVDYLWGRKLGKAKRIILFVFGFAVLFVLFLGFDLFLGKMFSSSPMSKDFFYIFAVGFGIMGFAGFTILMLVAQAYDIIIKLLVGKKACPGIAHLIPGIKIPNVPITVPLHAWISLLIILIIPEGLHGIIARREKFTVKSTGVLLLGFLPVGAFVEPDEEQLKKAPPRKALRVFAAGPTANIAALFAVIGIILLLAAGIGVVFGPWAAQYSKEAYIGVEIVKIDQNIEFCGETYPSAAYGVLREGMQIIRINDTNVSRVVYVQKIISENRYKPITLTVINKDHEIEEILLAPNELGAFGFGVRDIENPDAEIPESYWFFVESLGFLDSFFGWLFLLNLLIALVNFLPLGIFDGGRIANIIFMPYFGWLGMNEEDTRKFIGRLFLWIILGLFILNALPLFLF